MNDHEEVLRQAATWSDGGLGVAIVSTSKGNTTGQKARAARIGGEILAHVW